MSWLLRVMRPIGSTVTPSPVVPTPPSRLKPPSGGKSMVPLKPPSTTGGQTMILQGSVTFWPPPSLPPSVVTLPPPSPPPPPPGHTTGLQSKNHRATTRVGQHEVPQEVAVQRDSHTSGTPSFSVAEKPRTVSRGTDRRSATAARRGLRCALPRRSSLVAATSTLRPAETR